ncbi:hypothetical protein ZIOFF_007977 [Zingiber officinale]|uniref:tRNA (guanine(37)-N1)-methyltransferase n=1 Tax=Zingiber officinale TaxID=94328 RepID=A0A8J5HS18_ZINOF|nr:hypothetical protein ZIOFF_007977 [Zingiber officinale]
MMKKSMCCCSLAALRTHKPLPFPVCISLSVVAAASPRRCLSKSLSSPSSSLNAVLSIAADDYRPPSSFHFGPSLRRGHLPEPPPLSLNHSSEDSDGGVIEKAKFCRVFDVAALRVPVEECAALESHLRGHLLNWPRVRNIARVPGDDLDLEIRRLLREGEGDGGARLDSLAARVDGRADVETAALSPVLYREKLAKEFNCSGFLKFRNLAKLSRPKKKKKKLNSKDGGDLASKNLEKNDSYVVKVIGEEKDEVDLSGLLGEDFKGRRWRGPTRLLLLDEKYAKKGVSGLPEAIKVPMIPLSSSFELVQCQLALFYDYWSMSELLEALLPEGLIVPTGFETIGHIAHLNLRDEHLPFRKLIAQIVLDKNRPKIQTVVNKMDAIQNEYRTMQLEVLVGNHSLVTTVVENGFRFQVDLGKVYWNSKLATERQRLICSFTRSDVVCDVFSGVGPIAISAARKVKCVFANDLNPNAVEYLERNIVLNKLERKVEFSITTDFFWSRLLVCHSRVLDFLVFNMEGRRFISAMFTTQLRYSITQVVMNLPNDATEFLDAFRGVFRNTPRSARTLPKIHVYGFSKAQNPEYDFQERINVALCAEVVDVEMHRVRLVAPGKWMLCASFILPEDIAFGK